MSSRILRGVVPALAAAALVVAGCSGDESSTIRDQSRQGDNLGYISGDGTVQQVDPEDREHVVELTGTTLTDETWSSVDARGEVLVVNTWGDWCGPCHAEAEDLEAAFQHFVDAGEPVQFIGVNVRDSVVNAESFHRRYDITYPSLVDDGGQTIAALQGMASNTPTTLVLDRDGRIAARVLGQIDRATLTALVEDVLAE